MNKIDEELKFSKGLQCIKHPLPSSHPNCVYYIPPTVSSLMKVGLMWMQTNHLGEFVPSLVVAKALKDTGNIPSYPTTHKTMQRITSAFSGACTDYMEAARTSGRQSFLETRRLGVDGNTRWDLKNNTTRAAWRTRLTLQELDELFIYCSNTATLEEARCLPVADCPPGKLSLVACCGELLGRTNNRPMSSATLSNTITLQGNCDIEIKGSLGSNINHLLNRRPTEFSSVTFKQGKRSCRFWHLRNHSINFNALMPTNVFNKLGVPPIDWLSAMDFSEPDVADVLLQSYEIVPLQDDRLMYVVPPEEHSDYLKIAPTLLSHVPNERGCVSIQPIREGLAFEIITHLQMPLNSLPGPYSFITPHMILETYDPFTDSVTCLAAEMNDAGPQCSQLELIYVNKRLFAVARHQIPAMVELFLLYGCRNINSIGMWPFSQYPEDWTHPDNYNPLELAPVIPIPKRKATFGQLVVVNPAKRQTLEEPPHIAVIDL